MNCGMIMASAVNYMSARDTAKTLRGYDNIDCHSELVSKVVTNWRSDVLRMKSMHCSKNASQPDMFTDPTILTFINEVVFFKVF